jgi:hypothetical protein
MKIANSIRFAALVGAVAVAATACGGGGKPDTSAPKAAKAAASTTTLDPQAAQRAAVLAGYQAYADAYQHALASADAQSPELPAHMTGDALVGLRMNISGLRSANEAVRLSDVQLAPTVIALEPARAVVHVCVTSTGHYFDLTSGKPRATDGPAKSGWEDVLVLEDGTWKVSKETRLDSACTG